MGTTALKEYQTNVKKFKSLDTNKMNLEPGEKIAHCIDSKSFNGSFYYPQWVVSDKGRVWSLKYNKWMSPQILKKDTNAYWGLTPRKNGVPKSIYMHLLVCNYFKNDSDKIAIEFFGEDNVIGHHIIAIAIPKNLRGKGHKKEKMKQCMKDSCKSNIVYQEKTTDHFNDTSMANGGITSQEKSGAAVWDDELKDIRTMMYGSGQLNGNAYGTYYVYSKDENGNLKKSITQTTKLKEYLEKYDIVIDDYIVNADENMQFVHDNKELILEKIKENPPKDKQDFKGFILDNISICYSLK